MAREKPYYRDVVEDIKETTGKIMLTTTDVQKFIQKRYSEARKYMKGKKTITVYEFAAQLL